MNCQQFFLEGYDLTMKQLVERYQALSEDNKKEYRFYLSYLLSR